MASTGIQHNCATIARGEVHLARFFPASPAISPDLARNPPPTHHPHSPIIAVVWFIVWVIGGVRHIPLILLLPAPVILGDRHIVLAGVRIAPAATDPYAAAQAAEHTAQASYMAAVHQALAAYHRYAQQVLPHYQQLVPAQD